MQQRLLSELTLFQAREGGYEIYRIPGIVVTQSGTLIAYCEARKSPRGDWGTIDILLRRSADKGRTWGPRLALPHLSESIATNPVALDQHLAAPGEQTYNNPLAIADRSGAVHFLHCVQYARCYYRRSDDEGASWIDPVDITDTFESFRPVYDWRVVATGPGHGIQFTSGRLLVPCWLSTGTGGHGHRPSCVATIYSDDGGQTWQRGAIVAHNTHRTPNPSETVAVELADGRVMLNLRNESLRHRRLVVFSDDGATGWTEPQFVDALFEPVCCASMVRLPPSPEDARDVLLFANPDSSGSPYFGADRVSQPRENLTIRASFDDGASWPVAKVLEPGISGYCDLAATADGTAYCFYERGGVDENPFDVGSLTLARFGREWLLAEE